MSDKKPDQKPVEEENWAADLVKMMKHDEPNTDLPTIDGVPNLDDKQLMQGRNALFGVRPQAFQKYQEVSARKKSDTETAEVFLYGPIVSNQILAIFGRDFGVSDVQFRNDMEAITDDVVTIRINSPGGDVWVASSMVSCLIDRVNQGGTVNAVIDGACASAATFLSIKCNNVKMSPHGLFMIHEAETMAMGRHDDFMNMAKMLKNVNKNMARAYAKRTNMEMDDILAALKKELFMDSEEALEKGFIDEIMEIEEVEDPEDEEVDIKAVLAQRNLRLQSILNFNTNARLSL